MASAMALTEEDLSAMLQSSHPSQGHMSMSLSNAMLSSNPMLSSNAMDLLSGQLPYSPLQRAQSIGGPGSMNMNMNMSMQRGGLERSNMSSMGSLGSGGTSSSMSQASQWPFSSDEKWELDRKNELLDSAAMRPNVGNFGGRMEAPLQPLNQLSRTQGLQRYHSAPSSFLQCLADFNDEAFSHLNSPSPLGNSTESGRDDHLNFFNENLAPIMESAPSGWAKQPAQEKVVPRSNPMNSAEQYFAIQAENARQSALRESSMPSENMKSLSRSTQGLGSAGLRGNPTSASDFRTRTLKNNLLRQSSSPAELLAAVNERENNITPTTQQQIRSQEDSLSGAAFGENRSNKKSIAAMYSNQMYVFNDAMMASGGAWKMPTSPAGNAVGKRVRFPEEMTDDSDLLGEDGSQQNSRGGRTGSLLRHQSLPTNSTPLDPTGVDMGYDDLLDLYAPCKTRARRGYATHPRSIAERNRRSRISERMKKLQDLVPNMDKQTNTADMLDEAVEYVKHLQLQVKDLSATIVQLKSGIRQQNAG
ncbi:hypothetical protein KC19_2G036700 [Ceratodon purpureus]|uniref:BHLH domain-containing protein n=1 Tax=Ceratodon purpureus TaxID=3225 RepID=A0A8T0ITR6_CERPU|nr:hypothetical protein KC19_2G036700 [Ceratodon purpureus]